MELCPEAGMEIRERFFPQRVRGTEQGIVTFPRVPELQECLHRMELLGCLWNSGICRDKSIPVPDLPLKMGHRE